MIVLNVDSVIFWFVFFLISMGIALYLIWLKGAAIIPLIISRFFLAILCVGSLIFLFLVIGFSLSEIVRQDYRSEVLSPYALLALSLITGIAGHQIIVPTLKKYFNKRKPL